MITAVILAARKERDDVRPYPLKEYAFGENLIDRTLSILRETGFKNIILVTGFCCNLFEKYRSSDVTLVINENFEFTGSMGSLACVESLVEEDFILVEGDTFYEKTVVEKLSQIKGGNCFAMTEESGSGDECFVETKRGFVTKISKDKHRVCNFEGEMMGLTRISLPTFRRMINLWNESTNAYLNYEYVLMDVTESLDRPFIHFKNVIWGDVDCQSDFIRLQNTTYRKLCRRENPFDIDNLRNHIATIFPGIDLSGLVVNQIGGMSNKNFKVTVEGNNYVLRVPGNGADGMVDRSDEEFNSIEASKLGLNPAVRYFNSETGIKLADFIEDAETLNAATIQRQDNMKKVAGIYRTLHDSHIRLKNEFNIFNEIEKYERLREKAHAEMYDGWEELRPRVMALEERLNSLGVDLKPCHNDALYDNFLKSSDGSIYLIDWEYSGMNDPMADLAALFLEADFEQENIDYFLSKYFEGKIPDNTYEKILCYQILWDALWSLWTVIKEAKGDDFGTYGPDRFKRAMNNLNYLTDEK